MRASLGGDDTMMKGGHTNAGMLEPGRIILCVPDMSLVDFFREQVSMEECKSFGISYAQYLVVVLLHVGEQWVAVRKLGSHMNPPC